MADKPKRKSKEEAEREKYLDMVHRAGHEFDMKDFDSVELTVLHKERTAAQTK